MKALGIDIGGSAIKGAPVDTKTGRLLAERHRIEVDKRQTPAEMAKVVAEIAAHFKWHGPIGVGFPGVIEGATIWTSANLHPKFVGCDGAKLFGKATGCPVAIAPSRRSSSPRASFSVMSPAGLLSASATDSRRDATGRSRV